MGLVVRLALSREPFHQLLSPPFPSLLHFLPLSCRELLRDPSIKFAGYKHPHPLDNDILIRVQTGSARQTPAQAFVQCMHRLEGELRDMEHSFYSELQRVKKASGEFA